LAVQIATCVTFRGKQGEVEDTILVWVHG